MPRRKKPKDPTARPATPRRLIDEVAIASMHEINEHCLALLAQSSRARKPTVPLALISSIRDLLKVLQPEVRRRAAAHSFLLVDMEFADRDWWQAVRADPERAWKAAPQPAVFPKPAAIRLAREILTVAWHYVRSDTVTACVLLGMSAPVAEIIATLRLSEIELIAERQFHRVRLRWESRPQLWRQLLMAAMGGDPRAMREVAIHAHQLLSAETGPHSK